MMKRMISVFLAVILLLSILPAAFAMELEEEYSEVTGVTTEELLGIRWGDWPKTMYVYTEDHGKLNVRSEPKKGDNVIKQLEYGSKVIVEGPVVINADWSVIQCANGPEGVGYVMTRYLVNSKPSGSPKQSSDKSASEQKAADDQNKADLEELNRQLASAKTVDQPFLVAVRPSRTSGWVNFRVGPSKATDRVASLPDGRQLKVIGETDKWYQAIDLETGKTGYISKSYVTVLGPAEEEEPVKEQMGKLNVNGEFSLQCLLPEGYSMQLINTLGTKISALITSQDTEKPILQLSIAFDEIFADVERMNDLSQEALSGLEESFSEMNDVEITYTETAYGTKLLVAREVGDDTDFVDVLSVYKGYSIEFVMSPNPAAKSQALTDAQIQMCVDFLSELDFIPVK